MVWVPGGTFVGGSDNARMRDARPVDRVTLNDLKVD
jgi:hypothetical protein